MRSLCRSVLHPYDVSAERGAPLVLVLPAHFPAIWALAPGGGAAVRTADRSDHPDLGSSATRCTSSNLIALMAALSAHDKPLIVMDSVFVPAMQKLVDERFEVHVSAELDPPSDRADEVFGLLIHGHPTVNSAIISKFPKLKIVSNFGVGCDHIVTSDATSLGVFVANTPGAMSEATADVALALLLAGARNIVPGDKLARSPGYAKVDPNWFGVEVHGSRIGIVGLGRIGQAIARRALAFDMKVQYHNRSRVSEDTEKRLQAEYKSSLEELLRDSDFVVLAVPCNPATEGMIGAEQLKCLGPDTILVNIGRGKLVDHAALTASIEAGSFYCYATDVTEPEPLPREHPLLRSDRVIISPHVGSATLKTRSRMARMALDNLGAVISGNKPPHSLNGDEVESTTPAPAPTPAPAGPGPGPAAEGGGGTPT